MFYEIFGKGTKSVAVAVAVAVKDQVNSGAEVQISLYRGSVPRYCCYCQCHRY